MKTDPYFEKRRKVHRIEYRHVEAALDNEVHRERQTDGRWRVWGFVPKLVTFVRVVLLADEETVFNAFRDRRFKPPTP
ncbi:MAG: hypothetical protein ACE10K_11010 [Rhodothermales bacterium]